MKINSIDYDQAKEWLDSSLKEALIKWIGSSFNGIDAELYFSKYFDTNDAFARKLRVYFNPTIAYSPPTLSLTTTGLSDVFFQYQP